MSIHANMTPMELADAELGQLLDAIAGLCYKHDFGYEDAVALYETIEPTLTHQQKDAWIITLDMWEVNDDFSTHKVA